MATPFNEQILEILTPIFVFIFVFVAVYALLMKVKFFGDKSGFNLVIAFVVAMMFFIVPEAQIVVLSFTPWLVLLFFLILIIFMLFMFLGVKGETLETFAKDGGFVFWAVLIILILFLIAMTKAFGPFLVTNQYPGFWNSVKRTLFHPKTLGVLFLLAVASYTAKYIGSHQ